MTNLITFAAMQFLLKQRNYLSFLLQGIALVFLVLGSPPASKPVKLNPDSKTFICVSSAPIITARESGEGSTLSTIKDNLFEKTWLCVELIHSLTLITNTALRVSANQFNPFYNLLSIHAP
ncbi:MAG: hypothetical protein JNJ65_12540 [Cyclobacteriaceae bacterium]|nr:hypothetical protein [Cyclobacteriaceae bacterium]